MQIIINRNHNIQDYESLAKYAKGAVKDSLGTFADHITRVEVHVTDENAKKGGPKDKRCMLEARLEGRPPLAVTHEAESLTQAIDGAADKLVSLLMHNKGRIDNTRDHQTDPPPSEQKFSEKE